jgi:hypothetical protein
MTLQEATEMFVCSKNLKLVHLTLHWTPRPYSTLEKRGSDPNSVNVYGWSILESFQHRRAQRVRRSFPCPSLLRVRLFVFFAADLLDGRDCLAPDRSGGAAGRKNRRTRFIREVDQRRRRRGNGCSRERNRAGGRISGKRRWRRTWERRMCERPRWCDVEGPPGRDDFALVP